MSKLQFQGPFRHRIASFVILNRITLQVAVRHCLGRKIAPDWDILTETGLRFIRNQFTYAMSSANIQAGRTRFNSLLPKTSDAYDVATRPTQDGSAGWFIPANCDTDAVVLYCHGGGYTFRGPVTYRFAEMLAHHTRARVYMPLYRLTPEHAYPAQAQDALSAWVALRAHTPANQIVVIGDSAGGHMALMLLKNLNCRSHEQPALCISLSPWVDIGARGDSMTSNNPTDLVQGWMALQFGQWLDPDGAYGRQALSPVDQDFSGLAPMYIQAGGREILRDMIVEFAEIQEAKGACIQLDIWDDMPHNFQAYDSTKTSSTQAIDRLAKTFRSFADGTATFPARLDKVTRLSVTSIHSTHK